MVKKTAMIRRTPTRLEHFITDMNELLDEGWEFDGPVILNQSTGELFRFFVKEGKQPKSKASAKATKVQE
jgi:hypothetical protein|tara:strand:+ start:879 stop:1088 length:210 start_codon:yes stop_codon:yes gene_type:complete